MGFFSSPPPRQPNYSIVERQQKAQNDAYKAQKQREAKERQARRERELAAESRRRAATTKNKK